LLWVRGMIDTMSAAKPKSTAEDLRTLYGEDSRWELIHGELSEKAMPRGEHGTAQVKIATTLALRFNRKPGGKWPGGWRLLSELHVKYGSDDVFCHDLCGYRRDLHPELPDRWPTVITPDWVCELLSPGHHKRDRIDKFAVLFRTGVPHYWLVDPEEKILEVYRRTSEGYVCVLTAASGDVIRAEPFDAVELRAAVLFGDEDDDE
jgi:Uma2 family endonuclease